VPINPNADDQATDDLGTQIGEAGTDVDPPSSSWAIRPRIGCETTPAVICWA